MRHSSSASGHAKPLQPLQYFIYKLAWYRSSCNALRHTPLRFVSLRVLRFASQFVMLLAVPPHSAWQLICPSRNFVHFFLVTLHYTTFAAPAVCFSTWHTVAVTLSLSKCAQSLSQANPTILTGFHYASLVIHSLQYRSVHTLPSFVLLAGRPT